MSLQISVRILLFVFLYLIHGSSIESTYQWAVHIKEGPSLAKDVAHELGFEYVGKILDDYYLFEKKPVHRHRRAIHNHTIALTKHEKISWAEPQIPLNRVKRDYFVNENPNNIEKDISFRDTQWEEMWYLHNKDTVRRVAENHYDLNVMNVWKKGITGKGVVVTILDDGIEHNHTDLHSNYDPMASYDLNDDDEDPFPRYDRSNENRHGTRCAGEVSMVANNNKCGVGIAFDAKIGGIRLLDGLVTDSIEAKALNFRNNYIQIFSSSWGPNDDGKTVEGPGRMAKAALELGATKGRNGLGIIYVWASGNGGGHGDNCNCDGYTGSIYTLSISSATQHQASPWYVEQCPSTMATTYSSGSIMDKQIVSTDLHDSCTSRHTGTSASAPLAAGIFALVLQKNPNISWRDLQHMVAWTSKRQPLSHNKGWKQNAAGFWVNSHFGFGILDADALVNMADQKSFKSVPKKSICESAAPYDELLQEMYHDSNQSFYIDVICDDIKHLEHVQLYTNISTPIRGKLQIHLISPSGTDTALLTNRDGDTSTKGFNNWPFMSVHTWGEDPNGRWTVKIMDTRKNALQNEKTVISGIKLVLHGTLESPEHVKTSNNHQRKYAKISDNALWHSNSLNINEELYKSYDKFKKQKQKISSRDLNKQKERIDAILEEFLEMIENETEQMDKSYEKTLEKEVLASFPNEGSITEQTIRVLPNSETFSNEDMYYIYE